MASTVHPKYRVFISHAREDKATIALPLREKLLSHGITAFVGEKDLQIGEQIQQAMVSAMKNAEIAVVVLSPEFVARKRPMKQLMCFLHRRKGHDDQTPGPVIIPFFYRLSISDLYDEPRLDRRGSDGMSLYRVSRFLERMENGEPEADMGAIKAALRELQKTVGLRNDVNATNDSDYVMSWKRGILLDSLCKRVTEIVQGENVSASVSTGNRQEERYEFRPHFDVPYEVSKLVLDFESKDGEGEIPTQEAMVLEIVSDTSVGAKSTIAIQGIAGVGKTSLLQGPLRLEKLRRQFTGGIYFMSVGKDATQRKVRDSIIEFVQKSGGRKEADAMRSEKEFREVMRSFHSFFELKQCLFVVDDVWETKELSSNIIHELLTLYQSGQHGKVLITTRSLRISSKADVCFVLEPLKPLESQARTMLVQYSGVPTTMDNVTQSKAVSKILKGCSGLPLFLAVAGRAVKVLSFRKAPRPDLAYEMYALSLDIDLESLVKTDVDWYERLEKTLSPSISLLEGRMKNLGFEVSLTAAEMHRRLCVLEKQEKVPLSMLRYLWALRSEAEAAIIAREFEQMAIADIEIEEEDKTGYKQVLRLHDSLHLFARNEARKRNKMETAHEALLRGYGERLDVTNGCRMWWSADLAPDDYIHDHLCRLLLGCARHKEAVQLLFHPEWTARMFSVCGLAQIERDFGLCISELGVLRKRPKRSVSSGIETRHERSFDIGNNTIKAMELLSVAISAAARYITKNLGELSFQLYGRLKSYSVRFKEIGEYLDRIEQHSKGLWLRSSNCFLPQPILASKRTISLGAVVLCMVTMNDGERVACGCKDGSIVIVNLTRSGIECTWNAHKNRVRTIAIGGNGTRLVTGSLDYTTKVWDTETRLCLASIEYPLTYYHYSAGPYPVLLRPIPKCAALLGDGQRVVSGFSDGTAWVWHMDPGRGLLQAFRGHTGEILCVAVLNDGEHVVTGGEDQMLRLWSATSGAQVGEPFVGHQYAVRSVTVTADGSKIVSGCSEEIRIWDAKSHVQIGQPVKGPKHSIFSSIAVSQNGKQIAAAFDAFHTTDNGIRVWDAESGKQLCDPLTGHRAAITNVSFLSHDNSLVSCSFDETMRVWEVGRDNETSADRHEGAVNRVSFTPNGKCVVSVSQDRTLRIWDAMSGCQLCAPLQGHFDDVRDVALTPDGLHAVSVSTDKTVRVWDMTSRKSLHTWTGHTDTVECVVVTSDGQHAITGSDDCTIRIWDLTKMDGSHKIFEGETSETCRLFLSDDGLRIISVEGNSFPRRWMLWDQDICVWDIGLQRCVSFVKTVDDTDAMKLSRQQILECVGEHTVHDDAGLSIQLSGNEITYGEGPDSQVLATLEDSIRDWAFSPDKTTICAGLENGKVAIMRLERARF